MTSTIQVDPQFLWAGRQMSAGLRNRKLLFGEAVAILAHVPEDRQRAVFLLIWLDLRRNRTEWRWDRMWHDSVGRAIWRAAEEESLFNRVTFAAKFGRLAQSLWLLRRYPLLPNITPFVRALSGPGKNSQ